MSNLTIADPKRELLRHALATLAYRGAKAVRNVPQDFSAFRAGEGVRTPGHILAHIGDLMEWGLSIALGKREWRDSKPLDWEKEVARFFAALKKFDDFLALTHVGQISILRRLAGGPVKGESYYDAQIELGRVGVEQTTPKREF
jgi:hypothetical protein